MFFFSISLQGAKWTVEWAVQHQIFCIETYSDNPDININTVKTVKSAVEKM